MHPSLGSKLAQFLGEPGPPGFQEANTALWRELKKNWGPFDLLFGRPNDPRVIAALVIKGFMSLLGIVYIYYTLYAGFMWLTSAGEEDNFRKAKSTLVTGVIGIAVVMATFSIVALVVTAFGCATSDQGGWCIFFNNLSL